MKKLWFKAKLYGWGWYPATWEGWLVLSCYLICFAYLAITADFNNSLNHALLTYFLPVAILTITLIAIAYKTGENPRWRWGK